MSRLTEAVWFPARHDSDLLHVFAEELGGYEHSGSIAVRARCGAVLLKRHPTSPDGMRLCPHCLAALEQP